MAETVRAFVDVRVDQGPSMGAATSVSVTAYDKVSVTVPAAENGTAGTETIDLGPGSNSDAALLMITATRYATGDLTYSLGTTTVDLDGPHLFTGAGMLSLFDTLQEMTVTNNLSVAVTVSVLVARST